MANPFDQFDAQQQKNNPFDQFDAPKAKADANLKNNPVGAFEGGAKAVLRGATLGWANDIHAGAGAALNYLTNGAVGAPYDETKANLDARDAAYDKENPKTAMALKVAGGLAMTPVMPAVAAVRGVGLGARMANGAATGAAYGGVAGASHGNSISERAGHAAEGALMGASIGGAAPAVVSGVVNTAKAVADRARSVQPAIAGMERGAIDRVADAAQKDRAYYPQGVAPPPPGTVGADRVYAQQSRQLGPEGMLADMGPNMQGLAIGVARLPGEGKTLLRDAMTARANQAEARTLADTNAVLGPAQNLVQAEAQAVQNARAAAGPHYDAFYNTPIPADQQLVSILHRVPQSAWTRAKQLAEMEGVDLAQAINTGRGIDLIKRGVDDIASRAKPTAMNEGDPNLHRVASNLASAITGVTDRILSPKNPAQSSWAQARSAAGEGFQFREGIERGAEAFKRGTNPDQMAADFVKMPVIEQAAFGLGARGAVRDVMGNAVRVGQSPETGVAAAAEARKLLGSQYARDKLDQVVQNTRQPGQAPTQQLLDRIDRETAYANSHQRVVGNSITAEAQAAQKQVPSADNRSAWADDWSHATLFGTGMKYLAKGANVATNRVLNARDERINADLARILSATGGNRDAIMRAIVDYGQRNSSRLSDANLATLENALYAVANSGRNAYVESNTGPKANALYAR